MKFEKNLDIKFCTLFNFGFMVNFSNISSFKFSSVTVLLNNYKFELTYENLDIIIYFDNQSLNLVGWSTVDIYQNKVETKLSIVDKNIQIDQKIFDIRNYTN